MTWALHMALQASANRANINTALALLSPVVVGLILFYWTRRQRTKDAAESDAKIQLAQANEKLAEERRATLAMEMAESLERIKTLESSEQTATMALASLKQEMMPFSEFAKRKLIESLTHPSGEFAEDDALLRRVKGFGAAMPRELLPRLQARIVSTNPHVTEFERLAAEGLPIFTRMAQLEALHPDWEVTGMQLVTTTLKTVDTKKREESK